MSQSVSTASGLPPAVGSERVCLARLARNAALVGELVPPLALGEQVRAAVRRAAEGAGIALDSVSVGIAELASAEDR